MQEECEERSLFSVIIPVYNVEKYLRKCLDSVIKQDYKDIEIILVDDGSTDESGIICDGYAEKDERIQVIHKENNGLVSARKAGAERAKGIYVSCIDSDDWIEQGYYKDASEIISKREVDVICYACYLDSEKNRYSQISKNYLSQGFYSADELSKAVKNAIDSEPFYNAIIWGSLCRKIIRRELYLKYQMMVPDNISNNEDECVSMVALTHSKKTYISEKVYYHYLQRDGSIVHTENKSFDEFACVIRHFLGLIYEDEEWTKEWYLQRLYGLLWQYIHDLPSGYVKNGIPFIPEIKKGSRVIVYGKGGYAVGLMCLNNKYRIFDVVENIDSSDIDKIDFSQTVYDYIYIAIINYKIVKECTDKLHEKGVKNEKILFIRKKNLTIHNLPIEATKSHD